MFHSSVVDLFYRTGRNASDDSVRRHVSRYDGASGAVRPAVASAPAPEDIPDLPAFARLRAYAEIGYLKGVRTQLDELRLDQRVDPALMQYLDHLAREALLEKMARLLEEKA